MKELAGGFSMGRVAYWHDIRKGELPKNIDPRLTKLNVVLVDNIKGRTVEQFTNDEFQQTIDDYNVGKKNCRQIKGTYTDWHRSDKVMTQNTKPEDVEFIYEAVLCYGSHEDYWHEFFDKGTSKQRRREMYEEAVKTYKEMVKEFAKRYPHLKITHAVIHADEPNGSIHCHLGFQPRATEYQRGLKMRVSLSRALEQYGFEHVQKVSQAKEMGGFQLERLFKDFRHNVMNPMIREMGFGIKEEVHGEKHIENGKYQEIMTKAEATKKEAEQKLEQAEQTLKKAKEVEAFAEDIKGIEEQERQITYGTSKKDMVKKVIPPKFGQEQNVVISQKNFDSLTGFTEVDLIKRGTEAKEKKINKKIQETMSQLEKGADQALKDENAELKKQLEQKEREVRTLNKDIEKKNMKIDNFKFTFKKVFDFIKKHAPQLVAEIIKLIKQDGTDNQNYESEHETDNQNYETEHERN